MKCPADGVRQEDCSTRLVRKRQNCGLRSLSWYVEQWVGWTQQSAGDADRRVMTLAYNMSTGMAEPCHADICIPARPSWRWFAGVLVANAIGVEWASCDRISWLQWPDVQLHSGLIAASVAVDHWHQQGCCCSSRCDCWQKCTPVSLLHLVSMTVLTTICKLFVRQSITHDVVNTMACTIIGSCLDYWNSIFHGTSHKNFNKLQRVQNRAARIVCGVGRWQQSAQQLYQRLHWLPVRARTDLSWWPWPTSHGATGQPDYLASELHVYQPQLCLCSPSQELLTVPHCKQC